MTDQCTAGVLPRDARRLREKRDIGWTRKRFILKVSPPQPLMTNFSELGSALQMVESEKIAVSVAAHPPEPTSADARLTWERVWIRILVPFTFRLDSEHKAETGFDWLGRSRQALKDAADARRQPWKRGVYQREPTAGELPVHPDYTSDYYGHVIRFLFGDSEPTQTGCECWRIDPNDIARWLRNTSLVVVRGTGEHSVSEVEPGWLNRRERWPVNAIDDCGAELFLSQMGAGVLSISLELLPPVCRRPTTRWWRRRLHV